MQKPQIRTKRLLLRPISVSDLEAVHTYAGDPENCKMMMFLPNENIEETRTFLQNCQDDWETGGATHEFAIVYENQMIGSISADLLEDGETIEFGWIVNRRFHGRGIAAEAAAAVLQYCKETLQIRHFLAHCDAENHASRRIMDKIGLTLSGISDGRKNRGSDELRSECLYELHLPL